MFKPLRVSKDNFIYKTLPTAFGTVPCNPSFQNQAYPAGGWLVGDKKLSNEIVPVPLLPSALQNAGTYE